MRRLFAARGTSAAATGILVLLVAGGGYAIAASGGTITACAKKSNGALRLAGKCRKSERPVTWNIVGPVGPRGPQGPQGANGAMGPNGPAGAPATKYWATVSNTPTIVHQSGGITVAQDSFGPGVVDVTFPVDVSACAVSITVDDTGVTAIARKSSSFSSGAKVAVVTETFSSPNFSFGNVGFDIAAFC